MKNKKKEDNPKKELKRKFRRAKEAFDNRFFLETSWILSAVLETRVKNILEKVEPGRPAVFTTFEQDIKRLKFLRLNAGIPMLDTHFKVGLIDDLRTWKNQRNEIMKDMLVRHITEDRLERLATDGLKVTEYLTGAMKKAKQAGDETITDNKEDHQ